MNTPDESTADAMHRIRHVYVNWVRVTVTITKLQIPAKTESRDVERRRKLCEAEREQAELVERLSEAVTRYHVVANRNRTWVRQIN